MSATFMTLPPFYTTRGVALVAKHTNSVYTIRGIGAYFTDTNMFFLNLFSLFVYLTVSVRVCARVYQITFSSATKNHMESQVHGNFNQLKNIYITESNFAEISVVSQIVYNVYTSFLATFKIYRACMSGMFDGNHDA